MENCRLPIEWHVSNNAHMTTFYVLVLVLGICVRVSRLVKGDSPDVGEDHEPRDLGLPGPSGERRDDYVQGGGIGGAEGEGAAPKYHAPADGGVGGAEGGDAGLGESQRPATWVAEGLVVFGLAGLMGTLFTGDGRAGVVFLLAAIISAAAVGSKRLWRSR